MFYFRNCSYFTSVSVSFLLLTLWKMTAKSERLLFNMLRFVVMMKINFGVFAGSLKSLAFAAPLVYAFFYDNYNVAEEIIIMIVEYYIISLVLTDYMASFLLQKNEGHSIAS